MPVPRATYLIHMPAVADPVTNQLSRSRVLDPKAFEVMFPGERGGPLIEPVGGTFTQVWKPLEGSDNNALKNAESNESEYSCNSLAIGTGQWKSQSDQTTAKLLMLIKTEQEAAASVETILVREAGLEPAKHFKLAEQLPRALLHAQT